MPNSVASTKAEQTSEGTTNAPEAMSSPTSFLGNSGGLKLKYCLCRRAPCQEGKDLCELCDVIDKDSNFEGYLLRKVKGKDKLKKYWYSLLGKEMYVFDSKKEK